MKIELGGAPLAYEVHGAEGPWVVLSHSLGCSRSMWDNQVKALASRYRVLTYDMIGHGESGIDNDATEGTLADYAQYVLWLMDALDIEQCHFAGISVGGMIGQTLATMAPDRVASLVLANTTCFMPEPARAAWVERIAMAQATGVQGLAEPTLSRWFPESFIQAHPEIMAQLKADFIRMSPEGFARCCQAIMGVDTREALARIDCPVLIIGSTEDPGTSPEILRLMTQRIQGSQLVMVEGAGHLSNIDQPETFTRAMMAFLDRTASGVPA